MAVISELLQQRHRYYRALLTVEVLALVGLRGLQQAPRLVSVVYLLIAGMVALNDSPLLRRNRIRATANEEIPTAFLPRLQRTLLRRKVLAVAWLAALLIELSWQAALVWNPALAVQLSVLHLMIWLPLLLQQLWGLVNALAEEPVFGGELLMGAAAGYLLVGFTGGVVLNSLLVLDPAAFNLPAHGHLLPDGNSLPDGIGHAPAMLGAAFGCLTTIGSPLLTSGSLTSLSASVGITIVGQLYVAILIAGVLGKPRALGRLQPLDQQGAATAAPGAEHPRGRSAAARSRLRRPRR